jgi:predicted nucleic acid-binding protein
MPLLDTNVISELRKLPSGKADLGVQEWAKSVSLSDMYLSTITVFELEMGVLRIKRKDSAQAKVLHDWLHRVVLPDFEGRILEIGTEISLLCAALHVPASKSLRDSFIAATASVHGMAVVTRNVKDFEPMGVTVLNPWAAQG